MRDAKLKYGIIEKQVYTLVQALKYFRIYALNSPIIAFIPNNLVKAILNQPDTDGKRGRWIEKILEFYLDTSTTKLI